MRQRRHLRSRRKPQAVPRNGARIPSSTAGLSGNRGVADGRAALCGTFCAAHDRRAGSRPHRRLSAGADDVGRDRNDSGVTAFHPASFRQFRFTRRSMDGRTVRLEYALDDAYEFVEEFDLPMPEGDVNKAALEPLLDLLHWVAGVSYYKTA